MLRNANCVDTRTAQHIEILGSDTRAIEMGRLLAEAGYNVRSGRAGLWRDAMDGIIVQIGSVADKSADVVATEEHFPLLQVGLCCWLLGYTAAV